MIGALTVSDRNGERSEDSKADRNVQNVEGEGKEVRGNLKQKRDVRMIVGRKGAKGK